MPPSERPVVCCIGTTDPWNAAGLGLDVLALRECGATATTVVAAVSAQSRDGILALEPIDAGVVVAQLRGLERANVAAYRIGALASVAAVDAIAAHLASVSVPVVYDPVLAASAGGAFASDVAVRAIVERLVPLATVVTPNLREASLLVDAGVTDLASMERAGERLLEAGARAALVKGGHLAERSVDVLVERDAIVHFDGERLRGELRGTGCLLAAALAADLARGHPLRDAVGYAKQFVRSKFATAVERDGMLLAY